MRSRGAGGRHGMKRFAELFGAIDETTKTTEKVAAMVAYFQEAPAADAAWAVYFLTGRKPRQIVPMKRLRQWAAELAGVPDWLFQECYDAVADSAETIALLVPGATTPTAEPLQEWIEVKLLPLRALPEPEQKLRLLALWGELDARQRFVGNKLITGAFRVGVSQQLVVRALSEVSGTEAPALTHRLMGDWLPTVAFYEELIGRRPSAATDASRPYPFFLASPLEAEPETLGPAADWFAEWKWDGIRSQLIRRGGETFLWSRGEELLTERFPEIAALGATLPEGTVIDGEILAGANDGTDAIRPFAELQKRIGRKTVSKKLLAECPATLLAYDVLEWNGADWRAEPQSVRRERLEQLPLRRSPLVPFETWGELAERRRESRARSVEGLMLKRKNAAYRTGRVRGDWWKWKIEPYSIDAVLIYAQRGSGKRASLYTDYTFAVWNDGVLVPFAKAYSGLTDAEIQQVDAFIRKNTRESFGPVRTVTPELVFEIGFEGIQESKRHKSGVAVRFPRILRQRFDKKPADADTLARVQGLVQSHRQAEFP
ncbi:MAG: ATP-dependent DNA ligase [Gemmataceae bacterium]